MRFEDETPAALLGRMVYELTYETQGLSETDDQDGMIRMIVREGCRTELVLQCMMMIAKGKYSEEEMRRWIPDYIVSAAYDLFVQMYDCYTSQKYEKRHTG